MTDGCDWWWVERPSPPTQIYIDHPPRALETSDHRVDAHVPATAAGPKLPTLIDGELSQTFQPPTAARSRRRLRRNVRRS